MVGISGKVFSLLRSCVRADGKKFARALAL